MVPRMIWSITFCIIRAHYLEQFHNIHSYNVDLGQNNVSSSWWWKSVLSLGRHPSWPTWGKFSSSKKSFWHYVWALLLRKFNVCIARCLYGILCLSSFSAKRITFVKSHNPCNSNETECPTWKEIYQAQGYTQSTLMWSSTFEPQKWAPTSWHIHCYSALFITTEMAPILSLSRHFSFHCKFVFILWFPLTIVSWN